MKVPQQRIVLSTLLLTASLASAAGDKPPAPARPEAKLPPAAAEAPARWDRLEPAVVERAVKRRHAPAVPVFPAERP